MPDETLNMRIVDAMEELWKQVLAICHFTRDYTTLQFHPPRQDDEFKLSDEVHLPRKDDELKLSGKARKFWKVMSDQEFDTRWWKLRWKVEHVRPLVGEKIWSLYFVYCWYAVLQARKVRQGLDEGKLYAWNKDVRGEPEELTLLNFVFTEQELAKLNALDGSLATVYVTGMLEAKIMNEMNDWIFSRKFHKLDPTIQHSIIINGPVSIGGDLTGRDKLTAE